MGLFFIAKFNMKEGFYLIKISREEVDYLISSNKLKLKSGKYSELHITSKQKKSKRKNYFVPDFFKKYLDNRFKKFK